MSLTIDGPIEVALSTCARAMAAAGFSDITTSDAPPMVQGKKRLGGQWTKGTLAVFLTADGDRVRVETVSGTKAQSLVGVMRDPAERLAADFRRHLP